MSQKTSKKSLKNKGKLVWETLGKVAPHLRLSFSQKDEEIEEREEKADKYTFHYICSLLLAIRFQYLSKSYLNLKLSVMPRESRPPFVGYVEAE